MISRYIDIVNSRSTKGQLRLDLNLTSGDLVGYLRCDIIVIPSWFRVIPNQWCVLWFNLAGRHHWPQHQAIHYSRRYPSCRYLMTSKWPQFDLEWPFMSMLKYDPSMNLTPLKSNFRQTEVKSFSQWIWTVVWKLDSKFGQNVKCVGVSIIYVGDSNYLQKTTFSYCKYYYMSAHF